VFFIEFKRKGQKPTPAQTVEIEKIKCKGAQCFVVDTVELGKYTVDKMLRYGYVIPPTSLEIEDY
jgi:hypothetical protein